jgi:cytochrome c biogenesis protein CcmG/thiol:disulfide interchange protein DsbE
MWRFLIPGLVFAVLIGFFVIGLNRDPSYVPSPLIGKAAPAFSLTKVEDPSQQVSDRDFTGRKHLVNVWATWCAGCRQEHEFLLQVAKQNVVPIVGIDWKDELPLAQRWLSELGNPYVATGFDVEGRVAIDYGVYGAPETFLVDERGVVIYKHVGILTNEVWQNKLLPLIKAQTTSSGART